jgi:hypothetical protein
MYNTSENRAAVLPPELIEALNANKEMIDAFLVDRSAFNKHRLHTLLAAHGIRDQRARERVIGFVSHSRRWGNR